MAPRRSAAAARPAAGGRLPGEPGGRLAREEGNASVEFIGWVTVVLVPVVYLLVALAQVQAASFAVVSAADAASRVLEVDTSADAMGHARTAAGLALSDQGVQVDPGTALSVTCARDCSQGAEVRVEAGTGLPGLSALGLGHDVVVVSSRRHVVLPEQPAQGER